MKKALAIASLVITLFGAISTIYVSYDLYEKEQKLEPVRSITLDRRFMSDLTRTFENSSPEIGYSLTYQGKKLSSLITISESLENTGTEPITPQEVYEPLTVEIQKPWRILAIENRTTKYETSINPEWIRINERKFKATPFLFNPGDKVSIEIYATTNETEYKETLGDNRLNPQITHWNTRIRNLKSIKNKEEEDKERKDEILEKLKIAKKVGNQWPSIFVFLHGHGLLFFLLCTAIFSIIQIFLIGRAFESYDIRKPKLLALTLAAFLLSMSAAEVLSYYLFPSVNRVYDTFLYPKNSLCTHIPNFLTLCLFAVFLIFLGWKARIYERK